MSSDGIELTGLDGANPLGFLAALGTLGALDRVIGPGVRMHWTKNAVSRPVITGVDSPEEIVRAVMQTKEDFTGLQSLATDLSGPELGNDARQRLRTAQASALDSKLFCGLTTEGAYQSKQSGLHPTKPTLLSFKPTKDGKKGMLAQARVLRDELDVATVEGAIFGPWVPETEASTFRWQPSDDRSHAHESVAPTRDKRGRLPGPEWLAFTGLASVPVAATTDGRVQTTGYCGTGRPGVWSWYLWNAPAALRAAEVLAFGPSPVAIYRVAVPVRDGAGQGYGSFGPPTVTEVG